MRSPGRALGPFLRRSRTGKLYRRDGESRHCLRRCNRCGYSDIDIEGVPAAGEAKKMQTKSLRQRLK